MRSDKKIITTDVWEDEVKLSERSTEINTRTENKLMREIVSEIKKKMRDENLTSLSAPAIGYQRRIFCIDFKDSEIKTFINPIIAHASGISLSKEICSSVPGKKFIRPRSNEIEIIYQRPNGNTESRKMIGLAAYVFQHEIDHLDGLLISDIGLEIDDDFENASEEERQEVIEAYLDSLDMKQQELQNEIESNKELKQLNDGINFLTGVATGKIKLESFAKEVPDEEQKE